MNNVEATVKGYLEEVASKKTNATSFECLATAAVLDAGQPLAAAGNVVGFAALLLCVLAASSSLQESFFLAAAALAHWVLALWLASRVRADAGLFRALAHSGNSGDDLDALLRSWKLANSKQRNFAQRRARSIAMLRWQAIFITAELGSLILAIAAIHTY